MVHPLHFLTFITLIKKVPIYFLAAVNHPELATLTLIKWTDQYQKCRRCRIIPTTASKWRYIAPLVGITHGDIESIWNAERADPRCNQKVFGKWLEDGGYGSYNMTWEGLCELLDDVESSQMAIELKEALASKGILVNYSNEN